MATQAGAVPIGGRLALRVTRVPPATKIWACLLAGLPSWHASGGVNLWRLRNLPHLLRGFLPLLFLRLLGLPHFYGVCHLQKRTADGAVIDLGVVSFRVVTTAFVNKVVAGLNAQDTATFSLFKFHAFGSGVGAPASGDTGLGTEYTTQYATDNVRPTGSQVNTGNNIYTTAGTFTPDAAVAPTECGVLSSATVGAGTLMDRFTFSAVNLNGSGDNLTPTVSITFAAGG
jgi:hypothetical protein